jgi:hypothetical protein
MIPAATPTPARPTNRLVATAGLRARQMIMYE